MGSGRATCAHPGIGPRKKGKKKTVEEFVGFFFFHGVCRARVIRADGGQLNICGRLIRSARSRRRKSANVLHSLVNREG